MTPEQIKRMLNAWEPKRERTIVIVDFGNVEKWKNNLGWPVGIRELGQLVKNFSYGSRFLRRFYYGADYGPHEQETALVPWSRQMLESAAMNGFEVVAKRVKYIHSNRNVYGYEKKCDLDVEMTVDLIQERDQYDHIVLFSGDGDLVRAIRYLHDTYGKTCTVLSARGHVAREIIDAKNEGVIETLLFAQDFQYRLDMRRHRGRR